MGKSGSGLIACMAALALGACSTLPSSGPAGSAIRASAKAGEFVLVEVDSPERLPMPAPQPGFAAFTPAMQSGVDAIMPGDVLSIAMYEVGVRLFSGAAGPQPGQVFDPSARAERFAAVPVDREGAIRLPFVGRIEAAGRRPAELAELIERRLVGQSEYPQVVVTLAQANGSAVFVGGEVATPGRVPITAAQEKLLDVIALAGGYRGSAPDLVVRVLRRGEASEGPLASLTYANIGGMPMEPGDRVEIIRRPRTFSVLGTGNRVTQVNFPAERVSLVEALAQAAGPNENLSDPAAVFVFRYEDSGTGAEKPMVYHMNMMRPRSYLLAQKFMLNDKDVVYIGGAAANRPTKLLQIVSAIFTPFLLGRQLAD